MTTANTNVSQIFNDTIFNLYGANDVVFSVNCPFVPDEIHFQMAIAGIAVPLSTNLYTLESSFLGIQNLVQCNETNSYNPVMRFFNRDRRSILGGYNSRIRKHDGTLLNGYAQLNFTFIRYADA